MSEHDMTTVIVCGDDERLEARSECPNRLHDHPMPAGYVQFHAEASRRLNNRWRNKRCPDCNTYGWEAPMPDPRMIPADAEGETNA